MKTHKFTFCLALLLLCGCQSLQQQTADVSDAEDNLLSAANSIENSLRLLSAAQAKAPRPLIDISSLITEEGGLGKRATLDWSGPIESLLERVADMTDYQLRVLGNEPPIPVIVSITQENQVIAEILRDAGLQAGHRASLVVYPNTRTIELRYPSVT